MPTHRAASRAPYTIGRARAGWCCRKRAGGVMQTSLPNEPSTATPAPDADAVAVARWERNWQHEWAGARALATLAARARDPRRRALFERLATREEAHAAHWAACLAGAGRPLPTPKPGLYDRALLGLAKRLPARDVLPLLAVDAVRGLHDYQLHADAAPLVASEAVVAREVGVLAYGGAAAPVAEAGREHRRSTATSGSLRAAVFGVNDGLVSNLSLVMGVAGAAPDNQWVLLSGLAGLLAGAFSMGGGEFISMLAQRELAEKELAVEREHIRTTPKMEEANLARVYEEKG